MNNFENFSSVTQEQLDQAEKELIIEGDKVRELEKTESELLKEAKELKLSAEEFHHLITKLSIEFPSGETLATMFNESDPHKIFTYENFTNAWEQTGWPKLNVKEYEGELPLSSIEKMIVGENN